MKEIPKIFGGNGNDLLNIPKKEVHYLFYFQAYVQMDR